MGLWQFLQQWRGSRAAAGITASVLLHVLVVAVILWGGHLPLVERWRPKPGDSLIVELPKLDEGASPGTPDAPATPSDPQAPPIAVKAPSPPARPPAPAPAPRQVASAPRPSEPPARPAPRPSEAPRAAAPRPAEPPADNAADKAPSAADRAQSADQAPSPADKAAAAADGAATPRVDRVPAGPAGPQVASVPPGGPPRGAGVPDTRSALRRGTNGRGEGRGGILGDPIPLDTADPRFSDFMGQVKRQIQAKLNYPCIKNPGTFVCEPKDTQVIVQFGILKNGRLQFVELWIPSQWSDYDMSSMTAIRLAQPFPAIPPAIMATLPPGSTGIPITGRFMYQVSYSTLIQ